MSQLDKHVDNLLSAVDLTLPPGNQSYFTKKIIAELRDTRSLGQPVAQHDVSQLQYYYSQDLEQYRRDIEAANKEALG